MPKEPGEPQSREDEPKIEQITEAEAKEIEELRERYADYRNIGDIEKDIRHGTKILADIAKEGGKDEEGKIPYWERVIEIAKAEIKRREIKGER